MASNNHLTSSDVELYVENQMDSHARATLDAHLASCADCRARITRHQQFDAALRLVARPNAPKDLAARITAAVELRLAQEQARRAQMPLIAVAMLFSLLLALWFGFNMVLAFQEDGVLDFLAIFTSQPELAYSLDTFLALVESLPFSEIALTLFALVTAIVLAQQLVETIRPRAIQLK